MTNFSELTLHNRYLQSNSINTVGVSAFSGLAKLSLLYAALISCECPHFVERYLHANRLTSVPTAALAGLPKLATWYVTTETATEYSLRM